MNPFSRPPRSAKKHNGAGVARSVARARLEAAASATGETNQNPSGIGLLELLLEDFHTYERSLLEPGFWAVAVHRLANAQMDLRPNPLWAPLALTYRAASTSLSWLWGIELPPGVKLGRRVRIWHHGGIMLGARAIGDDVHIRHNTTLGLISSDDDNKPVIGNRVDIGVGACVLGAIHVGDDCVIGANSVVLRDLPPASTVFGNPARPVNLRVNQASRPPEREDT